MPSRRKDAPQARPLPRLYLVADETVDATAMEAALGEAARTADIAAFLLRPSSPARRGDLPTLARGLVRLVQARNAAFLMEADAAEALNVAADGVHCVGIEALRGALAEVKPDGIAGAGGLYTRHDAMSAGEAGADYVMFGEPDADGRRPVFASVLERIAWWSEVFEIPCVACAQDSEELVAVSTSGADFVALDGFVWNHARGPAAGLMEATERLRSLELA
ncbi:MAG: thiamine phosphate synthase [Rhizobiales bacterium]|nr:thiamine phosphate synthase [Hyphomicrobiales bacterium]